MKERNEEVARAEIKLSNMTRSSEEQNIQTDKRSRLGQNSQTPNKVKETTYKSEGQIRIQKK